MWRCRVPARSPGFRLADGGSETGDVGYGIARVGRPLGDDPLGPHRPAVDHLQVVVQEAPREAEHSEPLQILPVPVDINAADLHVAQGQPVDPSAQVIERREKVGCQSVLGVEGLEDVFGFEDRLSAVSAEPGTQRSPSPWCDRIHRSRTAPVASGLGNCQALGHQLLRFLIEFAARTRPEAAQRAIRQRRQLIGRPWLDGQQTEDGITRSVSAPRCSSSVSG